MRASRSDATIFVEGIEQDEGARRDVGWTDDRAVARRIPTLAALRLNCPTSLKSPRCRNRAPHAPRRTRERLGEKLEGADALGAERRHHEGGHDDSTCTVSRVRRADVCAKTAFRAAFEKAHGRQNFYPKRVDRERRTVHRFRRRI